MAMEMTGKMKKEKNQSNRMYNGNDERKRKKCKNYWTDRWKKAGYAGNE
jgi:hypothetical protein